MVIVVTRRTALAGLTFLTLLVLVTVGLVAPSVGQATSAYTRVASCAGLDFYPADSNTEYANNGGLRIRTDDGSTGGKGVFRCDPGLPNHAVVTRVQFTVGLEQVAQTVVFGVRDCQLRRSALAVATAGRYQTLGSVKVRTSPPGGVQRPGTTSMSNALVDNSAYGYWLECVIDQDPTAVGVGIYGADVYYRITAANG